MSDYKDAYQVGRDEERERMIQILERLGNHGVTHSERCIPRHWVVERAIEEIKGDDK